MKREEDYLYQHAINVTAYSILIGQSMQYHQMKLFDLALSALLYDFGMQFVDEEILYKPGELDEAEVEEIRKHTDLGFQHLSRKCFMKGIVSAAALQHHERFDGSGYPDGIKQQKIPFLARILSVADVYDAMASDRAYRKKMQDDVIIKIINDGAGTQFDPDVVAAFNKVYNEGKISRYMETGEIN